MFRKIVLVAAIVIALIVLVHVVAGAAAERVEIATDEYGLICDRGGLRCWNPDVFWVDDMGELRPVPFQ